MVDSKKTALVRFLGCKVNQAEAAAMARLLSQHGYETPDKEAKPDLVLVNTCAVTSRAESKSRRLVKHLAQAFPSARIVVTGCLAEVNPGALTGLDGSITVLGTFEKDRLDSLLTDTLSPGVTRRGAAHCTTYGDIGCAGLTSRGRAFLKIQDGCSQRCSYCIVPHARGPSRSLSETHVIGHAQLLAAQGYGEIVLTGVHLGHYGRDLTPRSDLEAVLRRLLAHIPHVRFRLSSIEPQDLTPGIIALAAEHPRMCRHFHIPVQSGDDRILAAMGRPYTHSFVADLLARLQTAIPDVCIGLDVMVGFPGEDTDAFLATEQLIGASRAAYLHVFPFSPRRGTPAALLRPVVPADAVRERVAHLRAMSLGMRREFQKKFIGRTLMCVAETPVRADGSLIARTDNYLQVRVRVPEAFQSARMFPVRLTGFRGGSMEGELAEESTEAAPAWQA